MPRAKSASALESDLVHLVVRTDVEGHLRLYTDDGRRVSNVLALQVNVNDMESARPEKLRSPDRQEARVRLLIPPEDV